VGRHRSRASRAIFGGQFFTSLHFPLPKCRPGLFYEEVCNNFYTTIAHSRLSARSCVNRVLGRRQLLIDDQGFAELLLRHGHEFCGPR